MKDTSVTLLGVKGGPAIRPGSNMPTATLVRAAGKRVLVDAGLGVTRALCDQGVALTDIDLVLVTHLHSDHYLELGPLFHTAWTAGLNRAVPVIGPDGLRHYWQHFCRSMAFDIDLRIADEGRCDFSGLADLRPMQAGLVHDAHGIAVSAMPNDHPPIRESYALKIEVASKTIIVSGDTAPMAEMVDFARGADLLVHEAMLTDGVEALVSRMRNGDSRLRTHILRSHTPAHMVGEIARDAGVKALALNHFVPDGDPQFPSSRYEEEVRKAYDGPLHVGSDGLVISL